MCHFNANIHWIYKPGNESHICVKCSSFGKSLFFWPLHRTSVGGQGSATWRDHTWMSSDKNSWILRQQRANGITKPVYQDMNTHGLWCLTAGWIWHWILLFLMTFLVENHCQFGYYITCLGWVNDACPVWDTFSTDHLVPLVILEWTVNVNQCPPDLLEAG